MEFVYSEDYSPIANCGKQTKMKIVGKSIYVTFERLLSATDITTKNIQVNHIRKPSYMSLLEDSRYGGEPQYKGQGHFSIIDSVQCHPNSYIDILNKLFHIPDFFSCEKVLNLSDKIITIWEEGLEINNTSRLKHENVCHIGGTGGCDILPIRFFLGRNNINSVEGTGRIIFNNEDRYKIYINEYNIPISNRSKTNTALTFTNEQEYKKTLDFLIDNLFSNKKTKEHLLNIGGDVQLNSTPF
jgi:hypothetical protein